MALSGMTVSPDSSSDSSSDSSVSAGLESSSCPLGPWNHYDRNQRRHLDGEGLLLPRFLLLLRLLLLFVNLARLAPIHPDGHDFGVQCHITWVQTGLRMHRRDTAMQKYRPVCMCTPAT